MNYELVVTLGPASEQAAIWHALRAAGASAFRLNTSHIDLPKLHGWLDRLASEMQHALPIVLDLQGSKWRLGAIDALNLALNQRIDFVPGFSTNQPGALPVPHPDFFRAAPLSDGEIVLNDARVRLRIAQITNDCISAHVIQAGPVSSFKGITFQQCDYRNEALSEKDRAIIEQTHHLPNVRYAISYVKDGQEMAYYRRWLGPDGYLIAKLERQPAMLDTQAIAQFANALWVCRGDLGAELGLPAMAESVHRFSGEMDSFSVPVLMAGQVLEHLVDHSTPTRSEVCYLYDSLRMGYQGYVLSDETAIGHDPVAACIAAAAWR